MQLRRQAHVLHIVRAHQRQPLRVVGEHRFTARRPAPRLHQVAQRVLAVLVLRHGEAERRGALLQAARQAAHRGACGDVVLLFELNRRPVRPHRVPHRAVERRVPRVHLGAVGDRLVQPVERGRVVVARRPAWISVSPMNCHAMQSSDVVRCLAYSHAGTVFSLRAQRVSMSRIICVT